MSLLFEVLVKPILEYGAEICDHAYPPLMEQNLKWYTNTMKILESVAFMTY